jgi:hypothetical protein
MLPRSVAPLFDLLETSDKVPRAAAFRKLVALTNKPVSWAYDAWDRLLRLAAAGDNHQRTIGVQLLANLAKSDPERRIARDLPKLFKVAADPMFVTARHSLLCTWKIAVIDHELCVLVMRRLAQRFRKCGTEKNSTLVRFDIQAVMRRIFDATGDQDIRSQGRKLIELEEDPKYRKKYATAWRGTA